MHVEVLIRDLVRTLKTAPWYVEHSVDTVLDESYPIPLVASRPVASRPSFPSIINFNFNEQLAN